METLTSVIQSIENLRGDLDAIDSLIIALLNKRKDVSVKIGKIKKDLSLPIHDADRKKLVKNKWGEYGKVYDVIHDLSKGYQK